MSATFNNINTNTINGQPYHVPMYYRFEIDPTSNPDPYTGGLIVNSSDTHTPSIFKIPFTVTPDPPLDLGSGFAHDPENNFTFNPLVDNTIITCNKTGYYKVSLCMQVLSNLLTPFNISIAQVLLNGQEIFGAPPGLSAGGPFINVFSTPIGGIYNLASLDAGAANVLIKQGDVICVPFFLEYDTAVISLTSNLSLSN